MVSVLVRVRVKVRVSFRLATFMYSVWPPVSLRFRVSLGFRDRVRLKVRSVLDSPFSCILYVLLYPIFLTPNPKNLTSLFNLPPNLDYV